MTPKNIIFYKRKNCLFYLGLIPSSVPKNVLFYFVSKSSGEHGPVIAMLALKHFGAIMGAASGRLEQRYGNVTIALEKRH